MDNLNFLFPRSCIEGKPLNLKAYEFVIDFIWGIEIQIRMCKFLYFGQLSKFWQTLNEKGPRTRLLGSHFSRLWININNQLAFWLQLQFLTWIMFYCISYIYIINSIQLYFSTLSNWLLSWALNISIREGNEPLETLRTAQSAKLWRVSFKLNTNTQIQVHSYENKCTIEKQIQDETSRVIQADLNINPKAVLFNSYKDKHPLKVFFVMQKIYVG